MKRRARRHPVRNLFFSICILLAAVSGYQYYRQGTVTWPGWTLDRLASAYDDFALSRLSTETAPLVIEQGAPAVEPSTARATNPDDAVSARSAIASEHRWELVGRVTTVTDGDSLELRVNEFDFEIRLFGVDTPEYDQPHGSEASRALSRKIARQTVLINVVDVDSYDRLVGTVFLDGQDINLSMVQEGHGWWYRQYAPDNQTLEQAEEQARAARLGLWAASDPVPPWEWRR